MENTLNAFKFVATINNVALHCTLMSTYKDDEQIKTNPKLLKWKIFKMTIVPSKKEINSLKYFINRLASYDCAAKDLSFEILDIFENPSNRLQCDNIVFKYHDEMVKVQLQGLEIEEHILKVEDLKKEFVAMLKILEKCNPEKHDLQTNNSEELKKEQNDKTIQDDDKTEFEFIIPSEITI